MKTLIIGLVCTGLVFGFFVGTVIKLEAYGEWQRIRVVEVYEQPSRLINDLSTHAPSMFIYWDDAEKTNCYVVIGIGISCVKK